MECLIVDSTELKDRCLYEQALTLVSRQRYEKIQRFVFEKDRLLSTAAGLFVKYIECRFKTSIHYGDHDKPLAADEHVQFNISHSGRFAVFVLSDTPVGIDIEEKGDFNDIWKAVMTVGEQSVFTGLPEEERRNAFYRLWTAKESYMKVLGTGLSLEPTAFEVLTQDGIVSPDKEHYCMYELEAPEGYSVTVCTDKMSCPELKKISCIELIRMIQSFQ